MEDESVRRDRPVGFLPSRRRVTDGHAPLRPDGGREREDNVGRGRLRGPRPPGQPETPLEGTHPFAELDSLLEKLEASTLDERDVTELEQLAAELEAAAARLERVA